MEFIGRHYSKNGMSWMKSYAEGSSIPFKVLGSNIMAFPSEVIDVVDSFAYNYRIGYRKLGIVRAKAA